MKKSKIALSVIASYLSVCVITFLCVCLYFVGDGVFFVGLLLLIPLYSVIAVLLAKKLSIEVYFSFCGVLVFLFILMSVISFLISFISLGDIVNNALNIFLMILDYPYLHLMMMFGEGVLSYSDAATVVVLLTPVIPCVITAMIHRNKHKLN